MVRKEHSKPLRYCPRQATSAIDVTDVLANPINRSVQVGERSARAQGWRRGSRLDPHETFVFEMIEGQKDITLDEMVIRLAGEASVVIGPSALSIWLGRRGWTFKKRPHTHWSRSGPTS